jgi:hypothetical protein
MLRPARVPQPTSAAVPSCVCCDTMVRTRWWQRRPLRCVALAAARREGVPCLIRQSSRHVGDLQPAGRYPVVLGGTRWYSVVLKGRPPRDGDDDDRERAQPPPRIGRERLDVPAPL